jgi:hypothetical protein
MSENNALIPLEQKTVIFYDDEVTAVLVEQDGRQTVYVPIRPICEFLGVDWRSQYNRIRRDPVLSKYFTGVVITTTPDPDRGGGGPQTTNCLPLDYLNGFLFGINAARVKEEVREQLIRYQEECYRVLAQAFLETPAPGDDWAVTDPEARLALQQIRQNALAVAHLAEEQLQIMARLDKAAIVVGQHGRRIAALERQLSPRDAITDEQALDIGEKVRAIAMTITEKDRSKNHFQAIFNEIHRRFRVSSYKNIRQDQYQIVLDFLDDWLAASE